MIATRSCYGSYVMMHAVDPIAYATNAKNPSSASVAQTTPRTTPRTCRDQCRTSSSSSLFQSCDARKSFCVDRARLSGPSRLADDVDGP